MNHHYFSEMSDASDVEGEEGEAKVEEVVSRPHTHTRTHTHPHQPTSAPNPRTLATRCWSLRVLAPRRGFAKQSA